MNVVSGMGGGGYGNPLGRASVTGPIAPPGALLRLPKSGRFVGFHGSRQHLCADCTTSKPADALALCTCSKPLPCCTMDIYTLKSINAPVVLSMLCFTMVQSLHRPASAVLSAPASRLLCRTATLTGRAPACGTMCGAAVPTGEGQAPALARASVVGVKHSSMGPAGPALAVRRV